MHARDGENIAEFIKDKLSGDKYCCVVDLVEIDDDDGLAPVVGKLSILLVSPELQHFIEKNVHCENFNKLFPSPRNSVLLRYNSESMITDEILKVKMKGFNKWTPIDIGVSSQDFQKAIVKIMALIDRPPELTQFSICPKSTDRVSCKNIL